MLFEYAKGAKDMAVKAGKLIQDGTLTWILDDVRDGARVGDIILRPTLRDGFIKANGATVRASEYPRLLAWVQENNMTITAEQYKTDCSKYVYDADADTLTLPNAVGRVLQGGETVKSVEAGLPNITGDIGILDTAGGGLEHHNGAFCEYDGSQPSNFLRRGDGGHDLVAPGVTAHFDASKSNTIYGNSVTVQPPAIALITQIKY